MGADPGQGRAFHVLAECIRIALQEHGAALPVGTDAVDCYEAAARMGNALGAEPLCHAQAQPIRQGKRTGRGCVGHAQGQEGLCLTAAEIAQLFLLRHTDIEQGRRIAFPAVGAGNPDIEHRLGQGLHGAECQTQLKRRLHRANAAEQLPAGRRLRSCLEKGLHLELGGGNDKDHGCGGMARRGHTGRRLLLWTQGYSLGCAYTTPKRWLRQLSPQRFSPMQDENQCYRLNAYDYHLPAGLIAQKPAVRRDHSRLLVLESGQEGMEHLLFADIHRLFRAGDVLALNNSRVFPARLLGHKQSGGQIELFLLAFPVEQAGKGQAGWCQAQAPALLKSSKRAKIGSFLFFGEQLTAEVIALHEGGNAEVLLHYRPQPGQGLEEVLRACGRMPLPPYISRSGLEHAAEDVQRYQTCYARHTGSVAAPTAGLHFTPALLETLTGIGVELVELTLHVGYGTFAPVRSADIREHAIHREWVSLQPESAEKINAAKRSGRRVWAAGTTSTRALESAAGADGLVQPCTGPCDLYIYPGFRFQVVDNLITNFHLPRSSLLFLVSALAGREKILAAYAEAIRQGYRFFSYGDAMAIVTRV